MKLDVLLKGLTHAQPAVRLDVVRVLGMLDEVRALPALRERHQVETDPDVKRAIAWAGKRLYRAQQAGYSTVDEVFRYFRVDQAIETTPDVSEQDVMQKLQDRFDSDLRDMQQRAARRKAGWALAAGLGGAAAGLNPMRMAFDALQSGSDAASSNLGGPDQTVERTPAMAPTDADITVWLKRLESASEAAERVQAILELKLLNNPRALPYLARVFLNDESPEVRQAAQQQGKILYWGAVYWDMERSGELAQEMQRRAAALGKTLKFDRHEPGAPEAEPSSQAGPQRDARQQEPDQQPIDVAEILRKAEEGRRKRKRDQR